jgi:hypothetical protein
MTRRRLIAAAAPLLLVLAPAQGADARFAGYNEDYSVSGAAPLAAHGGARLARFNVWWDRVERAPGEYHWSEVNEQFRRVRAAGMVPVPAVFRTPPWASSDSQRLDRPPRPDAYDEYARFVRALVERYLPPYVEVWNEPNNRPWWGEWPVEAYARLFRRVRGELLGLDVDLLAPSTAPVPGWRTYLRAFVRDVRGRYIVGQHIYHRYPRPLVGVAQDMGAQWRMARRIAGSHRRVWVTELGILSTEVGEQRQADVLANACTMIKSPVIVYSLLDHPDKFEWIVGFGVASDDFSPKPAYYALQRARRG